MGLYIGYCGARFPGVVDGTDGLEAPGLGGHVGGLASRADSSTDRNGPERSVLRLVPRFVRQVQLNEAFVYWSHPPFGVYG